MFPLYSNFHKQDILEDILGTQLLSGLNDLFTVSLLGNLISVIVHKIKRFKSCICHLFIKISEFIVWVVLNA